MYQRDYEGVIGDYMNELFDKFNADPIVQDILLVLIFFVVFTVIQIAVELVHKPYLNFENNVYNVYLFIPARNGSRYHEYRFVRKEDGRYSYVTDRIHPKYLVIGAAALFIAYILLRLFKQPIITLYVHGAFLFFLLLSTLLVFHPIRALIYLKRHNA